MAMLEEVEVPYEKTLIDINKGEQKTPEYLKIHPLGLVPAFRLANGEYIFESAGICMYLADLYPKYRLAPAVDDLARGIYNQWMLFLSSSIYPVYIRVAHPEWFSTNPSQSNEIKAAASSELRNNWRVVESALENRQWLLGDQFSTADIFMMMLSSWEGDNRAFASMFPQITRVAASAAERPAVRRALDLHPV